MCRIYFEKKNTVALDSAIFLQAKGTAMGTIYGLTCATIIMRFVEIK